jgi:hypothetical protein
LETRDKKKETLPLIILIFLISVISNNDAKVVLMDRPRHGSVLSFMSKQRHFGLVERTFSASAQHWGVGLFAAPVTYVCLTQSFSSA